jgi:hypothetical protein
MTEPNRNASIVPVKGWSAGELMLRGALLELCAVACVLLISLEGYLPGRWYYWGIPFLGLALTLLSIGVTWGFKSISKSKREIERGYTTIWKVAVQHHELSYLQSPNLVLISGPGEPRPRNGTRKIVDQFRAQRAI